MTETLTYIESYFLHELPDEEKKIFEKRCEQDKPFAEEVAFYITSRQVLKEQLIQQKKTEWKEESEMDEKLPSILPAKKSFIQRWLPYAAAACFLLAVGAYFFERSGSPQQYAAAYINENLIHLSQNMDGGKDSLQQGLKAFNEKQYDQALQLFESISKNHPDNSDAKKYAGFVYLVTNNYDKALEQFDFMANMKLHSNPGLFYKAITLLQRNKDGDAGEAKQLLLNVEHQHLDGSKDAEEILKKF